jgi:YD repeat-containing protein
MTRNLLRAGALSCALLTTTALAGPAFAQTTVQQERQAPDENGVDVISGRVSVPLRSITAGRPGEGGLTYASGWADGQYFDTFQAEISPQTPNQPMIVRIHGQAHRFTDNGNGTFSSVDGDGSTLILDGDSFTYTARDGTEFRFSQELGDDGLTPLVHSRLSTITRPDGEVLTYHYRLEPGYQYCTRPDKFDCNNLVDKGRVQSVTSNLGYQLKATYVSDSPMMASFNSLLKVTAINNAIDYCNPAANACAGLTQQWPELTVAFTSSGRTVTNRLNQTVTIRETAQGVAGITSPANPSEDLTITYDSSGRVATLSKGGGTWTYSYSTSGSTRITTVTQPMGGSQVYVSDLNLDRLLSVTDELGNQTSFQYDAFARPTRVTADEGNYVQTSYDSRGNVTQTQAVAKPGSGLAPITTSASFPATCTNIRTCNQPVSTTDARNNVTDYTYDPGHGGLLTATGPAPVTGGVRPQLRYAYASVSAYSKNSTGTVVAAASPVTRMASVSTCRTLASCAGTADEVRRPSLTGRTASPTTALSPASRPGPATAA